MFRLFLCRFITLVGFATVVTAGPVVEAPPTATPVDGNAVIRAPFGPSEIVITTTTRLAGAIHSLRWNGREYDVTFTVPDGERHTLAQFEALTAYLPPDFSKFWTFRENSGQLEKLDDGPGEQAHPVVFSTNDGAHALGILGARRAPPGPFGPLYGRFRFAAEKVVKWNCVYRARAASVVAGSYDFRLWVVIGTLDDVRQSLAALGKELK